MTVYKLFWDDFCAWYLEIIKPGFNTKIDKKSYDATMGFFDSLLKLLHPYMPFITEELWQNLSPRREGETIMLQQMPEPQKWSQKREDTFEIASQAIINIRNIRQSKGISNKESLNLFAKEPYDNTMASVIEKLANVSSVDIVSSFDTSVEGANFLVGTTEFFVPLKGLIDEEEEREKINAEIEHLSKFLAGVNAKLSNERFVSNAPASVVAVEQKKKSDATQKIESLNNRLKNLNK